MLTISSRDLPKNAFVYVISTKFDARYSDKLMVEFNIQLADTCKFQITVEVETSSYSPSLHKSGDQKLDCVVQEAIGKLRLHLEQLIQKFDLNE